jgi:Txe/YoeB family toxin of Txe-Axe toxin-antitoxin module
MQDQNQSSADLPQINPKSRASASGQPDTDTSDKSQKKQEETLPAENQQISQGLPKPASGMPPVQVDAPKEAADSDLIEKEWVEKAKQIVERTRDNPYQQQEELSKMKAEYLKKRYNREINSPSE